MSPKPGRKFAIRPVIGRDVLRQQRISGGGSNVRALGDLLVSNEEFGKAASQSTSMIPLTLDTVPSAAGKPIGLAPNSTRVLPPTLISNLICSRAVTFLGKLAGYVIAP